MRLIFKHIFKDIMAHKLRTLLLMLCIIVCSFTAMLCFDLSGSLRTMLKGLFATVAGSSDLQIQTKSPVGEVPPTAIYSGWAVQPVTSTDVSTATIPMSTAVRLW